MNLKSLRIGLLCVFVIAGTSGCVVTNATRLSTATESRAPVLPKDVALYRVASQVPRRYEEVALLNSAGDANYTNESKMFESMKKEAGKVGANGVILDALSEPGAGAKVAAAIFGVSAQRKGKALAIWVFPADVAGPISPEPRPAQAVQVPQAAATSAATLRPFGYSGEPSKTARAELLKAECADGFALVSEAGGRSIYEATCRGGKRQLLECWSGACRALN